MQWHRDAYTIDTDFDRLDFDYIVRALQTTYWATGRPEEIIRGSWQHSALVFGVYHGNKLVGFCRVVSDLNIMAHLADVFVDPVYRGDGIGTWLVETAINHPQTAKLRWMLHTLDAHELYRKLGFGEPSSRVMERTAKK